MSIWTQINGSITLRDLTELTGQMVSIEAIKKIMGNTCQFDGEDSAWDDCTVPCGSEGSLCYVIYRPGRELDYITQVIIITGALRDYEDVKEIKAWFEKIILSKELPIREATLQVRVSGRETHCFSLDSSGKKLLHLTFG